MAEPDQIGLTPLVRLYHLQSAAAKVHKEMDLYLNDRQPSQKEAVINALAEVMCRLIVLDYKQEITIASVHEAASTLMSSMFGVSEEESKPSPQALRKSFRLIKNA